MRVRVIQSLPSFVILQFYFFTKLIVGNHATRRQALVNFVVKAKHAAETVGKIKVQKMNASALRFHAKDITVVHPLVSLL